MRLYVPKNCPAKDNEQNVRLGSDDDVDEGEVMMLWVGAQGRGGNRVVLRKKKKKSGKIWCWYVHAI